MSVKTVPTDLLSHSKMVAVLKSKGQKFDTRFLKADFQRNELEQIFHRPKIIPRKKQFKISALPRSFQVDIAFLPQTWRHGNGGVFRLLVIIDIPSRRAWAYTLKSATMAEITQRLDEFKAAVGKIRRLSADDGFNNEPMRSWCAKAGCDLYTDVAKDDHAAGGGNKLGIVDRFCRTLKLYIRKWVVKNDSLAWTSALTDIMRLYNGTPHMGINNRTPIEMWADENAQVSNFFNTLRHNIKVSGTDIPMDSTVRIYIPKTAFGKESYNYSRELYTVIGKDVHKYILEDSNGRPVRKHFKPHELLVVDEATLRPIAQSGKVRVAEKKQAHIDRVTREGLVDEKEAEKLVEANSEPPIITSASEPRKSVRERRAPQRYTPALPGRAPAKPAYGFDEPPIINSVFVPENEPVREKRPPKTFSFVEEEERVQPTRVSTRSRRPPVRFGYDD